MHAAVDGPGRPLADLVTGGQRNDGAMLAVVLADIRVPRTIAGRPRTTPDALVADRAYSSGVTRRKLARRGIKAVIPQKKDEIAARRCKGSAGGRPPHLDTDIYRGGNIVERHFNLAKQWRGLAAATTSSPSPTALPTSSAPASSGRARRSRGSASARGEDAELVAL
jgi:transposase